MSRSAKKNINLVGRQRLLHLREQMDQSGSQHRSLIVTIDGRLTNRTVLSQIPQRTTLIGRVRKDSAFYFPVPAQAERGRKRKYGARCPSPEELLKDPTQPWQTVSASTKRGLLAFLLALFNHSPSRNQDSSSG